MLDLIEKKAAGEEIVAPVSRIQPDKVIDLMAALEASVAAAKEARARHPTAHDEARGATTSRRPRRHRRRGAEARKAPAKKARAAQEGAGQEVAQARRKSA